MNTTMHCADAATDEPLAGTADSVDVWLLLEYRPPWRARTIEDNDLAASVRDWIAARIAAERAKGRKCRPQFVRRPERDAAGVTLFVADAESTVRYEAADYDELTALDLDRGGERVTEPHFFVCTNSARDACCGRLGLPLYGALRERVGARAWQTTHVGGHRFAPNVLALPEGRLYGRVHAREVDAFLATIERGALGARWLRGRSFLAPEAQAAEVFVAGARDEPASLSPLIEVVGERRWRVSFADGRSTHVGLGPPQPSFASCGDAQPKDVRPFQRI